MIKEVKKTWLIESAVKDAQTINARWEPHGQRLIDGVRVKEVANVPKAGGYLIEIFRREWDPQLAVDQVFQVVFNPGVISAWHAHAVTTDRLFVSLGMFRIVLFDTREGSPTRGLINDFRFGTVRPALLVIPPRVWHGVMNEGSSPGIVVNLPDRAYAYDDPDHWRLPPDSPEIPFKF